MVSEVPSTPNEPGFQATENSSGLSIPFPPVVLLLVFALSGVPLGMGAVSGYFFSFHLFCRQAKKKKNYHYHALLQGFLNHQKVAHKHPFCLLAATF